MLEGLPPLGRVLAGAQPGGETVIDHLGRDPGDVIRPVLVRILEEDDVIRPICRVDIRGRAIGQRREDLLPDIGPERGMLQTPRTELVAIVAKERNTAA